jgi:8-oxo-dGTP pyrophosphatase MutT (NUDIX family)
MKAIDITQENMLKAAGCLIMLNDSEEFLFIQRSDKVSEPLSWSIPGGMVDPGESPLEAAIRECYEEINHVVNTDKCKLLFVNDSVPNFSYYTYICITKKKFKPELNWESSDYTWCTLDQVPEPVHLGIDVMFSSEKVRVAIKNYIKKHGVV